MPENKRNMFLNSELYVVGKLNSILFLQVQSSYMHEEYERERVRKRNRERKREREKERMRVSQNIERNGKKRVNQRKRQ